MSRKDEYELKTFYEATLTETGEWAYSDLPFPKNVAKHSFARFRGRLYACWHNATNGQLQILSFSDARMTADIVAENISGTLASAVILFDSRSHPVLIAKTENEGKYRITAYRPD